MTWYKEYIIEIIFGIVSLTITIISFWLGFIDNNIATLIGTFVTLTPIALGYIRWSQRKHIDDLKWSQRKQIDDLLAKYKIESKMVNRFNSVYFDIHLDKNKSEEQGEARFLTDQMLRKIKKIKNGIVHLDSAEAYYDAINKKMDQCDENSKVFAINCIDVLRNKVSPHQKKYMKKNFNASKRKVKIHRLFLLRRKDFDLELVDNQEDFFKRRKTIIDQVKNENIVTHIVWMSDIPNGHRIHVKDWVLFMEEKKVAFIDYHDRVDPTRVVSAEKVLNPELLDELITGFNVLKSYSISDENFLQIIGHQEEGS